MILSVSAIAPARLTLTTEGALAPGQVETDMVAWQGPLIAPEFVAPQQKANQSFRKFGLNAAFFFHEIA